VSQIVSHFNSLFLFSVCGWGCSACLLWAQLNLLSLLDLQSFFSSQEWVGSWNTMYKLEGLLVIAPSFNQPEEDSHCFSVKFTLFFSVKSSSKSSVKVNLLLPDVRISPPQNSTHLLYFRIEYCLMIIVPTHLLI